MSILDCLQPRTVTVTGARVVKLGLGDYSRGGPKRMNETQAHASYDTHRKQQRERKRESRK